MHKALRHVCNGGDRRTKCLPTSYLICNMQEAEIDKPGTCKGDDGRLRRTQALVKRHCSMAAGSVLRKFLLPHQPCRHLRRLLNGSTTVIIKRSSLLCAPTDVMYRPAILRNGFSRHCKEATSR